MIAIFEAELNHLPVVRDIAYQTWPSTYVGIVSEAQIDYMLGKMYDLPVLEQQMTTQNCVFLLAKIKEEVLGFVSYQVNYQGKLQTKIHKIYLLPQSQGQGVGKALVEAVEAAARTSNNNALVLNVNRQNKAVQFYEKVGFVATASEDLDIGQGYFMKDFIMTKTLF